MILQIFRDLVIGEDGQGMTEYAIVLGVIGAGSLFFVSGALEAAGELCDKVALELADLVSKLK